MYVHTLNKLGIVFHVVWFCEEGAYVSTIGKVLHSVYGLIPRGRRVYNKKYFLDSSYAGASDRRMGTI